MGQHAQSDAKSKSDEPTWLTNLVELLRANRHEFERHDKSQLLINRVGDQVSCDITHKSIKLT